ncbi:ABC-type bacteriocin/lantibiotic exporter, contains an N-terminal double-glycine peptidase domain [Butyrivibrio sp. ob235]|uniref:peptidase domain-containing ABC transporter n=1 Tax=Butyrivibrio sp. ob235 TaxID=1761780 RepID=UPI0008B35AF1|nr:peptidase domain-containing ABC transporter [Butyrivibrio sp. ob235]SEM54119.1 ABC-type bacteriocin/lantibiotic exporter, contains an N-terminal double-glycine peptidase domain [Butyrivibrio sp. ob235]
MANSHLSKVPYIEQMQAAECGLCCLAMILQYYKSQESLADIREDIDVGRDGLKLSQMYMYAQNRKFYSKVFSCGMSGLRKLPLPAIIFWNNQHYVVLEKIGDNKITIVDPATGRLSLSYEDFAEDYSNVAMVMVPTDEFVPKKRKNYRWNSVLKETVLKKKLFYITALISLISYGLQLLLSVIVQKIFDSRVGDVQVNSLEGYLALVIGVGSVFAITTFIRKQSQIRLQIEIDKHLTEKTFRKMLSLPYQFFERRTNGDLLFRLNCLPVIRELLSDNVMNGIIQCGFIVVILTYMTMHSMYLTITAMFVFFLNGLFILFMRKKIIEANQVQIVENTKLQSLQTETVQSIFNIKTAGIEQQFFSNWLSKYCKGMKAFQVKNKIFNIYSTVLTLFQLVGPFLVLWVGLTLTDTGKMTLGQTVACYSLSMTFFGSAVALFHMWNDFIIANSYLDRVNDILHAEEEKDIRTGTSISEVNTIELKNVSMTYSQSTAPVLKNINLKIGQGEKVAIVGKSGSGKSSLIKLMLGLYNPSEGEILVNDLNLREIKKVEYRKSISIVPQDIYLFNKSILENIRMNNEDISLDEVTEAAKIAQVHDEIDAMPMKYYTVVSNMGMNLSGGQRQRIALARAIVSRNKFMILDEATSSLDNINEKRISDYFAKNGCTQVVVAHRLSTIKDADRIIVLDKGEIAEEGTHETLLKKNGIYTELYYSKNKRDKKYA